MKAASDPKLKASRILVATLNVAAAVSAGGRKGSDKYAPPKELRVEGLKPPETVDEAVLTGVMLLTGWAGRHRGQGSSEWPEKLQGWLDDWQNDFRRSDAGDEAAGFQRLAELLGTISQAIYTSSVPQ